MNSGSGEENAKDSTKEEAPKEKEKEKKGKKKSKKANVPPAIDTQRQSSSSFEIGKLPSPLPEADKDRKSTLGKKKSILGLGLPSTMRLPNKRNGSTASSILAPTSNTVRLASQDSVPQDTNRLSVESALLGNRARSPSASTTNSSLRPMSTTSSNSNRTSSGSSVASASGSSVRWDEDQIETMRGNMERDRKRRSDSSSEEERTAKRRENRHSAEGRKRAPISGVFSVPESPESKYQSDEAKSITSSMDIDVRLSKMNGRQTPMVVIEAATADGHSIPDDDMMDVDHDEEQDVVSTPAKRVRPRPMSEQMLGRERPKGIHDESGGDGEFFISPLDIVNN
jgi:serine/arginine repetitive matrix protein 2